MNSSARESSALIFDGLDDVRTSISIERPWFCLKADLSHAQAAAAESGLMIALCSGRPMPEARCATVAGNTHGGASFPAMTSPLQRGLIVDS